MVGKGNGNGGGGGGNDEKSRWTQGEHRARESS